MGRIPRNAPMGGMASRYGSAGLGSAGHGSARHGSSWRRSSRRTTRRGGPAVDGVSQGGAPGKAVGGRRARGGAGGQGESTRARPAENPTPLVPGFGVEQETAKVPAFGERVDYVSLATSGSSSNGPSAQSASSGGEGGGGAG